MSIGIRTEQLRKVYTSPPPSATPRGIAGAPFAWRMAPARRPKIEIVALEDCRYDVALVVDDVDPQGEIGRFDFPPMSDQADLALVRTGGVELKNTDGEYFVLVMRLEAQFAVRHG